jgi:hypothetical protein
LVWHCTSAKRAYGARASSPITAASASTSFVPHNFAISLALGALSLVQDEKVETLVRTLAEHLASWGVRPLLCVFDRPKTIALQWRKNGEGYGMESCICVRQLEMGVGVELCWPYQAPQNGVAERWVGSVRHDLLDHVIPLNERHLRRLLPSTSAITTTAEPIWAIQLRRLRAVRSAS